MARAPKKLAAKSRKRTKTSAKQWQIRRRHRPAPDFSLGGWLQEFQPKILQLCRWDACTGGARFSAEILAPGLGGVCQGMAA